MLIRFLDKLEARVFAEYADQKKVGGVKPEPIRWRHSAGERREGQSFRWESTVVVRKARVEMFEEGKRKIFLPCLRPVKELVVLVPTAAADHESPA